MYFGTALQAHVKAYAESHSTSGNKALHYIGIPLAAIGVLGLLAKISLPEFTSLAWHPDAACLALVISGIWYLHADWRTGFLLITALVICYLIGSLLQVWVLAAMFSLAAILHAI